MVANTLLEIYTLMFGWNMYEAIWDVLVGSGLALVPFIVAVIANFQENYASGQAASTVKGMETTLLGMILVLMLCVLPYRGFTTQLSTVRYELDKPDCNPPPNTSGTGDNTVTAFDGAFTDVGTWQVHKPVAWSFVEFLSSAITHTTIKSMGCVNNYEYMLLRISHVTIQDDQLKDEVRAFKKDCYQKGLERFKINPVNIPANVSAWDNIDWIGSRILLGMFDEYYTHPTAYMADMEDLGFNRQPVFRVSDQSNEEGANPYCKEVWLGEEGPVGFGAAEGLRQKLLDDIPSDEAGQILQAWKDWGSQVLTQGVMTDQIKEDLILKLILQNDEKNLSSATDLDMTNDFDAEASGWRTLLEGVLSGTNLWTQAGEFLQANAIRQMFKIAGPMILALIQMVVIIAAPFVMLFGRYQFTSFLAIAITYFSLEFINAIWAAGYWFDNRVLDIYGSIAGFPDKIANSMLIQLVSTSSTILLPMIWLSVMAYAGAGMLRGMGAGGVGGGVAAGSTAFNRGASGVARGTKEVYRTARGTGKK